MKVILTESQIITLKRNTEELNEIITLPGFFEKSMRRNLTPYQRHMLVALAIIDYMDKKGITTIPTYRTLTDDEDYQIDTSKYNFYKGPTVNWKTLLGSFLEKKDLDTIIKPMIAELKPEYKDFSSGSKVGAKNQIIDNLRIASLGELIVYNTFKMNGIILEHEPNDQIFTYTYVGSDGVTKTVKKIPDFYWREKNIMIEVAGLTDSGAIAKDYLIKINAAKEEMLKQGREYIILDYYKDRNNKPKFFKLVCGTFNFNYIPDDYFKVISGYKGIDREFCKGEVERILRKPVKDTTGAERARVAVMMRDCLSKTIDTSDGTEEVGYTSKWDVRRDMGIGKRVSPEVREKVQKAWCESPLVSAKATAKKYSEMYGETMSHSTVEIIMKNNRDMFDKNNKENICSKFNKMKNGEKELDERGRTFANTRKKRLFPKSAMMANPLRFKEYDKEVKDLDEVQTRTKRILGKGRERVVYLSHTNPDMVFKLWGYDDLVKEKEFFDKYPDLYVKIYKVKPYNNSHYDNVGYAIMDRVDTKGFKQECIKLQNAIEEIGFSRGIFGLVDGSRNEKKYDEIVDKLNDYDPSLADFFINLRDCVIGVENTMGRFEYFDRSFEQFGLDKEGNVKCFDI